MYSRILSILSFFAATFANELYEAIKNGEEDKVTQLLMEREPSELTDPMRFQRGYKENLPWDLVSTPLLYALAYKRENIAKILMEKGANLEQPPESDVFYAAITLGLDSVVQFMMERGFDVTENVTHWSTYLHYAVKCERPNIVKLLCDDERVDVEAVDDINMSPLELAICHNSGAEIVSHLLKAGADVRKRDKRWNTVLHRVNWRNTNHYDLDVVNLLLSHQSVEKEARNMQGRTPLLEAAYCSNERCFEAFLAAGANIHVSDYDGQTAVHYNAGHKNEIVVSLCKSYGLNFETADKYGMTPLLHAVALNSKMGLKWLVNAGGNVNARNTKKGYTALYIAAEKENPDLLEVLLLYGADVRETKYVPECKRRTSRNFVVRSMLIEAGLDVSDEKIIEYLEFYDWSECFEFVKNCNRDDYDSLLYPVMKEFLKNFAFGPDSRNLPHLLRQCESKGTFALYKMLKKYCGKVAPTPALDLTKWDVFGKISEEITAGTYFHPLPFDVAYDVLLNNQFYGWKLERLAFNLALLSYYGNFCESEVGDFAKDIIFSESFAPVIK